MRSLRDEAAIDDLSCRVFEVPTDQPEADGTIEWSSTTVVVVEVKAAGSTGTGWTYGSAACRQVAENELASAIVGSSALDV
ncbi:MAG: enolase C-terminal domain-like protein, partial [Acidimicrobiales bacterium]